MSDEDPTLMPLSESQMEVLEEATATYVSGIDAAAARYLHQRGIDQATAVAFRVGRVADPLPGHERYRGWLSIPYLDKDGKPLTMRFRCPEQHNCRDLGHGKYMSLAGDPSRTFNIGAIHRAALTHQATISITEGEFDTMVLTRLGVPSIAIPGAQGWSSHHRRMLAGFNRIWVWGDPDDAGADFNRKVTGAMRQAKAVRLRAGDVTDTWKAGGAQALLSLIETGDEK